MFVLEVRTFVWINPLAKFLLVDHTTQFVCSRSLFSNRHQSLYEACVKAFAAFLVRLSRSQAVVVRVIIGTGLLHPDEVCCFGTETERVEFSESGNGFSSDHGVCEP